MIPNKTYKPLQGVFLSRNEVYHQSTLGDPFLKGEKKDFADGILSPYYFTQNSYSSIDLSQE